MIYPPGFSGAYIPIRPGCEVKEEEEKDNANNSVGAAASGDGTAAAVEGIAGASATSAYEDADDEEAAAAAAARAVAQAEAALLQSSGSADAMSFFSALMAQVFLSLAERDVCAYDGILLLRIAIGFKKSPKSSRRQYPEPFTGL